MLAAILFPTLTTATAIWKDSGEACLVVRRCYTRPGAMELIGAPAVERRVPVSAPAVDHHRLLAVRQHQTIPHLPAMGQCREAIRVAGREAEEEEFAKSPDEVEEKSVYYVDKKLAADKRPSIKVFRDHSQKSRELTRV